MQTEEQDKNLQLSEEEITDLSEKGFRVMMGKKIQDLGQKLKTWIEKTQEKFNKELEGLKNKQRDMNKIITAMKKKKTLEGINSRITKAGEWISDLENRMAEISAEEQNKENTMERKVGSLRDL